MAESKPEVTYYEFQAQIMDVQFRNFEHKSPYAKIVLHVPEQDWHKITALAGSRDMVEKSFNVVLSDDGE